ncbi:MAG: SLC13 family permease [Chloroflexi bacterium]|nr:MAG: SLC13 family permease [Chloroflexota bacterium]
MTLEIALAFALLFITLVAFALDLFPIDFIAFSVMAVVLVVGPYFGVSPEEAISGFSNPATITVLAMFIISGAISRTGAVNLLARRMVLFARRSERRLLVAIMGVVGGISAFINNTAAVAILIPTVITMARKRRIAPSKLLIPLSYFSQLAGVITLIGTSTNVLASALADQAGIGAFGMFEFAPIGLLIFLTGAGYLLFFGYKLLPVRPAGTRFEETYRVKEYLSEVVILEGSPLVGTTLAESRFRTDFDIHVLEILRNGRKLGHPLANNVLQAGDILFVKANTEQLLKIKDIEGLAIEPELRFGPNYLDTEKRGLMEVIIGPNSELIGGTLKSTNFHRHYYCTVIAIRKHGELIRERLGDVPLHFGDTLLLRGAKFALEEIKRNPGFIVTEEVQPEVYRTEKIPTVLAIVGLMILAAALGVPILVAAVAACVLLVLTGCLQVTELHESIRWDVIFLLAGVIPLGLVLERSGGAHLLAELAAQSASVLPPVAVLGIFYFITMVLTGVISNNAAVVMLVPVGIETASALGLPPKVFILAIMFAASSSFYSPVGYQTNAMVFGPGGYKFIDFVKVGLPLNLILAVLTPIYIYLVWGMGAR